MFERILVAYDGSVGGADALRKAARIAQFCNAELTILTVYRHHSLLEASFSVQHREDQANIDDVMREHSRGVAESGKTMAIEAGAQRIKAFTKSGQPARTIVAFAAEHDADLIVVGSRGLGSVEGFLLGSVSHKITGLAKCAVLVV